MLNSTKQTTNDVIKSCLANPEMERYQDSRKSLKDAECSKWFSHSKNLLQTQLKTLVILIAWWDQKNV